MSCFEHDAWHTGPLSTVIEVGPLQHHQEGAQNHAVWHLSGWSTLWVLGVYQ